MPFIVYKRVPAITQISEVDCWLACIGMLARYHQDYNVYAKLPKGDFWRKVKRKEGLDHEDAAPLLTSMGFSAVAAKPANKTTPDELYKALAAHGPLWFPLSGHVVVMIGVDTESDMVLFLDPQAKMSVANPVLARQLMDARRNRTGISRDWDAGIWDSNLSVMIKYASDKASVYCLKTGKPPKEPPDVVGRLGLESSTNIEKPSKKEMLPKQPDVFDRLDLDTPKSAHRKLPS